MKAQHYGTKKQLQEEFERCQEVLHSLTTREIKLLWYLRHARLGDTVLFLRAAQQTYEATQALKNLSPKEEAAEKNSAPTRETEPSS